MSRSRLERILQFLEQQPDAPFLLFAAAKEYEKTGEHKTALAYYLRLTDEHADYVGTYYHLGKLYERMDQLPDARATYERGLAVSRAAGDHHAFGELRGALDLIDESL